MAEEETTETLRPSIPAGRVKKIMKLDKDINKVNAEALLLISCSTELFLRFLAEKSAEVAIEKKRKTVRPEYLRIAAKKHRPTGDFLLDSLPAPSQPSDRLATERNRPRPASSKPIPAGTRRIDDFFCKSGNEAPNVENES
ncbi:hypothetical protein L1049_007036 [Liquidambar formosana]|uniref:Transcription factor CBF/NF-Y/archaeal histone domain-containing protein n=1 Tax=Liquidambar formosana TaxID=63359 RepID=A0AAP0WRS5_LIQFO